MVRAVILTALKHDLRPSQLPVPSSKECQKLGFKAILVPGAFGS